MSRMGAVILSVLLGIGWMLPAFAAGAEETKMTDNGQGTLRVRSFQPGEPICRASREATLVAVIENAGAERISLQPRLLLPAGVKLLGKEDSAVLAFAGGETRTLRWRIAAAAEGPAVLTLQLRAGARVAASADLTIQFLPAVPQHKLPYIPEPQPVQTSLLIGAHHCPLWEADKPSMWANILKHPERTPALGFYAQENPEVSDWETKWAVEHGVSFFVYCWYRASQGEPVKTRFSSAIHDALFKSKFANKMKFTIMWENQSRGKAGIADMRDLEENLLPFWIENYFKHPSYLKIDNKPLLFIYRPEFLIKDLGSVEQAAAAIARMRQACRDAGFAGLYVLG
ncbi:MAG TPA: glycoside hydrolase family 99-like domain-containing protein, partial [Armatimonadota bacterium]|nr:glycoside hydrolase family 99-like domain-containing protein [Armatimonadota bacterium]